MNIYEYMEENFDLVIDEKYRNCSDPADLTLPCEETIIGHDYGTDICIDSNGEIISSDPEQELPTRFINKDLKTFLEFLNIFSEYYIQCGETDEEEQMQLLENIKEEFNRVDSRALDNEENWWSVILEQIEMGLM